MRSRGAAALAWLGLAAACAAAPRDPCDPDPAPGELGTLCGFGNPEDVEAVPAAGLLLVSQMRPRSDPGAGSIAALPLADPRTLDRGPRILWPAGGSAASEPGAGEATCTRPPPADTFAPHGLTSRPQGAGGVRVAVVVHGARESIELFDLRGRGDAARLVWRGCVPLPDGAVGNDVALGPGGDLVTGNYQPTLAGWAGLFHTLRGGLGLDTGEVLRWQPGRGWEAIPDTEGPNPNGVLIEPGGRRVFVALTGGGGVAIRALDGDPAGVRVGEAPLPGHPDNLSWSPRDTILAVTHTDGVGVLRCRLGRRPCRTGWSLYEIDPFAYRTRLRLHHDGSALGAAASASEVDGRIYFGAVFDDRIGFWEPARG